MSSILNNAHSSNIHNNTFVTKVQGGSSALLCLNLVRSAHLIFIQAPSLDTLFKRVAPHAILNAGGRADEPRCHPGTREEVIGRIENWRDAEDGSMAPIFWLSGPAGAGKSAIVQTISKRCDEHGAPHANFFFFRTDPSRNQVSPLIATLVYQLISVYPSLRDHIATLLFNDPPMIDSALKDQLAKLIVAPLRTIQQSSPAYRPVVFLIDGLDECDSETKRGQQQILHTFDAVIAEISPACPFRLLVASRNESQIQMAFNKLSSNFLPLHLDSKYSPAGDIRKFVRAKFEEIRKTHPLGHILDANWPTSQDVNYIVEKSSGQFIFAATAMRFILESSAAPTLSLERVKGAARLAKKSPFSHLDAIYTYILLQVDDQEALKDVLNARLFINSLPDVYLPATQLVELYNQRYTNAVVLSCLADLSPIAHFSQGRLEFYHASFPDFLLDQLRSGDHFVDIAAFIYKVLPIVCKHFTNLGAPNLGWSFTIFLKIAITRLNRLPPELLDALILIPPIYGVSEAQHAKKIYQLCTSDEDVSKFRCILCHWTRHWTVHSDDRRITEQIPFGPRYYQMAYIKHHPTTPDGIVAADLCPESDFDRRESALWLKDLLHDLHRTMHTTDPKRYKQLLKAWISWAISNDISLECHGDERTITALHDCQQSDHLPYICRYFAMVRIERDCKALPSGDMTAALCPETDTDRHELASWLQNLLHGIYQKKYKNDESAYKEFITAWIFWAIKNDIPLRVDIPYSRRYFAMSRIECNYEVLPSGDITAALHPETDADRRELALWLQHLLNGVHRKKYENDEGAYRKFTKAWIYWSVQNNIPLGVPSDRPNTATVDVSYSRRYFAMARIEHSYEALPSSDMTAALHPETDVDRYELALWLKYLLHGGYRERYATDSEFYKRILKFWISWAIRHDITCYGLRDLPGAPSYIRRATLKKRVSDAFKIGGSGARQ